MNSRGLKIVVLIVPLVALVFMPLLGGEKLQFADLFSAGSFSHRIFFELRLPRLWLTILVGGSLAMLGGTYQVLFHNALAEPYIFGTSSAVSLGVAMAEILWGVPASSVGGIASGFAASLIVTFFLVGICLTRMGEGAPRIVLFGMGINFVLSSCLFLLLSYYYQHIGGGSIRWLFGSIPWLSFRETSYFALASVPFLGLLFLFGRHLDALSLGDSVARTLGFAPTQTRTVLLFVTSAFLSLIVSFTGAVGFVGLVVPHAVRLIFRPSTTRLCFVYAFYLGAFALSFSDLVSRTLLPPFEFPIGIITTLIGGPVFLYLLWRR